MLTELPAEIPFKSSVEIPPESLAEISFDVPSRRVNHILDEHWYQNTKYENLFCPECPNLRLSKQSSFLSHLMYHENEKYGRVKTKRKTFKIMKDETNFRSSKILYSRLNFAH